MEPTPTPRPSRIDARRVAIGCGALSLVALAVPIAGIAWWSHRAGLAEVAAEQVQAERAAEAFAPALEALAPPPEPVDLDRTIRVVHGLDLALREQDDFDGWLRVLARQDHRGVAPEVLEARADLLRILQPLYAKQTELAEQQAMWELTSEMLLATLSVVSVSGDVNLLSPEGQFAIDRDQAKKLWTELKERQASEARLRDDVEALDRELFDALLAYSETYWKYVEEWDKLAVLRDRAYLAAYAGDWVAAEQSARVAIERAPNEREAHLLAAMAILEQGQPERFGEAKALLEDAIERHPDQSAPALLLLGVLSTKQGDPSGARLHFQQAAAYYPKQSDQLLDMLDPYKMRAFLEKSREGTFIVELYRSTMLGAGYFSPDLQLARLHFDEGDFAAGRAKVLDHFARRRSQKQWDFVISDITFCQELLGADYRSIFPEDAWLDLEVSRPMLGSGLVLAVDNRGDRTLHNATLVLALHLTDQFPGQYSTVPAPETVPAVVAHAQTPFGTIDPQLQVSGIAKTIEDVVEHRAVLITDEAVVWVDTEPFKLAEAEEFRTARAAARAGMPAAPPPAPDPAFDRVLGGLTRGVDLKIEERFGKDDVLVQLPRELSVLRPMFQLRYGEEKILAQDNLIEGDKIVLRFPGVLDGSVPASEDLELALATPYGELVLQWTPTGALTWDYRGLAPAAGR